MHTLVSKGCRRVDWRVMLLLLRHIGSASTVYVMPMLGRWIVYVRIVRLSVIMDML